MEIDDANLFQRLAFFCLGDSKLVLPIERIRVFGRPEALVAIQKEIGSLNSLKEMSLIGDNCSDETFSEFSNLRGLRRLEILVNEKVTGKGLAFLPKNELEMLDLGGTKIDDVGLTYVSGFQNLVELRLNQNVFTDEGMSPLGSLKKLNYLNLNGTSIRGIGVKELAPCVSLETLILGDVEDANLAISSLPALPNLRNFSLRSSISCENLRFFRDRTKLKTLELKISDLDDQKVHLFPFLWSLTRLDLKGTKLTDRGKKDLSKFFPNATVNLMD